MYLRMFFSQSDNFNVVGIDFMEENDEGLFFVKRFKGDDQGKQENLMNICKIFLKEYESIYGVLCVYQVVEENGMFVIFCFFFDLNFCLQRGKEIVLQLFKVYVN